MLNSDLYLKYKSIGFNTQDRELLIDALKKHLGVEYRITPYECNFPIIYKVQFTYKDISVIGTSKEGDIAKDRALYDLFNVLIQYL